MLSRCLCVLLLLQETCDALSVFGIHVTNNTRTGVGRTYSHACTYVIGKRQQKWALLGEWLSPPHLSLLYCILLNSILYYLLLSYSILFRFILSYFALPALIVFYFVLLCSTLFYCTLFHVNPLHSITIYLIQYSSSVLHKVKDCLRIYITQSSLLFHGIHSFYSSNAITAFSSTTISTTTTTITITTTTITTATVSK